jgi:hypothetical protein
MKKKRLKAIDSIDKKQPPKAMTSGQSKAIDEKQPIFPIDINLRVRTLPQHTHPIQTPAMIREMYEACWAIAQKYGFKPDQNPEMSIKTPEEIRKEREQKAR